MQNHTSIEPLETRIAPAGIVLVAYDDATHTLTITGDDFDNTVGIFQVSADTWRVEGRDSAGNLQTSINEVGTERFDVDKIAVLSLVMAGGNDRVEIVNLRTLTAFSADMGAGNDTLKTEGFTVKGNATISSGAGVDSVEFDGLNATVKKNLSIDDSADGLIFNFRAEKTTIGGSVSFIGSASSDMLTMQTDTALKIGKQLEFTANGGADKLSFGSQGSVKIGRDTLGRSIIYNGGAGNDRLGIGSNLVSLRGSVEMTGGNGNDTLDLDGLRVSVGKSIAGISVQLTGDAGSDQIDLQGSSLTIVGLVKLDGGADADMLDLSSVHRLSIKGGTRFDGGFGTDEFKIGADALFIAGGVEFIGGDEADIAEIEGNGTIKGGVTLDLGGAASGKQDIVIQGRNGMPGALKIIGALTVNAMGAGITTDTFKLDDTSISGAFSLMLGDGISTVDMDNFNIGGALTLDTRDGSDSVELERDATFGTSAIRKLATIILGAGDDTLLVGKDSKNNRVRFFGDVIADGGIGTDTRNELEVDNERIGPATYAEMNFEVLLVPPV